MANIQIADLHSSESYINPLSNEEVSEIVGGVRLVPVYNKCGEIIAYVDMDAKCCN
jgi:hypothetical protein